MSETIKTRELPLAPNEYLFLQNLTKGTISVVTGPFVVNQTGQDVPVIYDKEQRCFSRCESLEQAVRHIVVAPEGYYVILLNPATDDDHPAEGKAANAADLKVGRRVNVAGPCKFALWPGQSAEVVRGHHLRSNQYLSVRVYNAEEATANWPRLVVRTLEPPTSGAVAGAVAGESAAKGKSPVSSTFPIPHDLAVGRQIIMKGTDASFFIPCTGITVVKDADGEYVRDAMTLEQLDYCILRDEDGRKRYERGPKVVFPEPTETFLEDQDKNRRFRAVELNELQGIHIKVITDYHADDSPHQAGEEMFITGADTPIYFPREEHSLVLYDGKQKHFAVAVPVGEARYVMDRRTGEIAKKVGPAMLLPNPVDAVIARRVLKPSEYGTWYPGNEEVAAYNRELDAMSRLAPTTRAGTVSEGEYARRKSGDRGGSPAMRSLVAGPQGSQGPLMAANALMEESRVTGPGKAVGDQFTRESSFTAPRTLVINSKFDGVPSINVWTGYAVMVVKTTGERRVEQGPVKLLLDYDETLELMSLSTSKPKTTDKLLVTPYLRVKTNKVADIYEVETKDHVRVVLKLSHLVDFEGDSKRWWNVENYVKLLCDHARSLLKGAIQKFTIEQFYADRTDIVRDALLGKGGGEAGARVGLVFPENGMHVRDVEVLGVEIGDNMIAKLLDTAQHEAVQGNITLEQARRRLSLTKEQETINREVAVAKAETGKQTLQLEKDRVGDELTVLLSRLASEMQQVEEKQKVNEAQQALLDDSHASNLRREIANNDANVEAERKMQVLRIDLLKAETAAALERFSAMQGGLAEALLSMSNQDTLCRMAEAMSVQNFIGGKSVVDVLDKVFDGSVIAPLLAAAKAKIEAASKNGSAKAALSASTPGA